MGMGQEDEATNETIDQIRREHHSIKTWYNNNIDNINVSYLRSKYGNYPTFWQDVMKWDGYKETWKLYWKDIELQKNKNNDSSNNGDGNGSSSTNNNRKRKSRWSSRNDDTTTTTATSTTANNNVSTDSNTKSEQQKQQQQPTTAVQCEKKKPRRSRWSSTNPNKPSSTTSLKPTAETGILGLLPGIPKGMTQYEKLFALWGVTTQQDNKGAATSSNKNTNLNNNDKQPTLPNTIESLTNELCNVITNTLYNKQYYDPKIITNIRSKNILINYRPYVKKNINYNTNNNDDIDHDRDHEIDNNDDHDNDIDIDNDKKEADDASSGTTLQEQQLRIGIELDGLRYLNTNYYRHHNNNINNNNNNNRKKIKREEELEIISLIKLSLLLSSKLSQCQWKHIEEEVQNDKKRTIMLHFTTLSETIIASKQLLYLRQLEKQQEYYDSVQNMNSNTTYSSIYDCFGIRGRGSVKEGARGRRDGKAMDGDDEPLHVVITGDEQSNVDRAGQLINDMLVVIDDEKNVHKQQQLQVKCAICGDTSHPTRDYAMKTNVVD